MTNTAPHVCSEAGCGRSFLDIASLSDHADNVHTYGELQDTLNEEVREAFGCPSDPMTGTPGCYTWVRDFTDTWVVFSVSDGSGDNDIYQVDYTLDATGTDATFGTPVEVIIKTTYVPAPADDDAPDGDLLDSRAAAMPAAFQAYLKNKQAKKAKGGATVAAKKPASPTSCAALPANFEAFVKNKKAKKAKAGADGTPGAKPTKS